MQRFGPDVNKCYAWDITFISNLGLLPNLIVNGFDLKGTAASITVSKQVIGKYQPFDSSDYGSETITDLSNLSVIAHGLKQGINYFFWVSVTN